MIEKPLCDVWNAKLPPQWAAGEVISAYRDSKPSCRAFRLVGDSLRFLFLKLPREYKDSEVRIALYDMAENGVTIACSDDEGRVTCLKFEFLGFTESTLKSGHIILLQKQVNHGRQKLDAASLLSEFGNLLAVYYKQGPGKYIARLGLSFSATIESVNPTHNQVVEIADASADNGVLTTDGCGIIRESYAKEIRKRHNLDSRTCVFQIRRGGIKGLLVAYPDSEFDTICRKNKVNSPGPIKLAYRPSMLKYIGGPTHIEINAVSEAPRRSRLSLSIVIILVSLGVKYGGIGDLFRALKELLKLQLRTIEMIAYDRQEALSYIEGDLDAEGEAYYQDLYEMLLAGHSLDEPYVRKRIRQYQKIQYTTLREKLSIKVQKSCSVYGVVDELGVLSDDEVYIQLPHREGVVVSKVLIARHPSHKPSDVRLMKAVYKPELHFLSNCIVFPRTGAYSVPGAMSGGDLDGDKYFVCWEPTIFPRVTDQPSQGTTESNKPRDDWSRRNLNDTLVELFVEQRHNRLLGRASREWQSVVESYIYTAGAMFPRKLADIIEEALDILKSGNSYAALRARYEVLLSTHEAERLFRKGRRSKLHALRNLVPSVEEDESITYVRDPDLILDSESPKEWQIRYEEGERLMRRFNAGLARAMDRDEDTKDESAENPRRRAEDNPSHVKVYMARCIDACFPKMRNSFLSKANQILYMRASAWYAVGYDNDRPAFAWLGARFLNNIKSYKTSEGRPGLSVGALNRLREIEDFRGPRDEWLLHMDAFNDQASAEYALLADINRLRLGGDESEDEPEVAYIGYAEVVEG